MLPYMRACMHVCVCVDVCACVCECMHAYICSCVRMCGYVWVVCLRAQVFLYDHMYSMHVSTVLHSQQNCRRTLSVCFSVCVCLCVLVCLMYVCACLHLQK